MKFKLYSLSALAIAAMMTACSSDEEIVQAPVNVAEVATPAITLNLDEMATRGFLSEKGAWTNFKANANQVGDKYDARVTLMIYSVNNSTNPIAVATTQYLTQAQAAASGDQVSFEPLRVPAGASYTAVAFVDFVGKDHANKFYDVANLNNVKMLAEGSVIMNGKTDAEMRDCYNGKVTFTLTQDGTLGTATADATGMVVNPDSQTPPAPQEEAAENKANVTTLNILARRHLGKVRIVMTDYATYGEWKQYFKGEDAGRAFNAEAMKVKEPVLDYNALTEQAIPTLGRQDKVFVSEYNYQTPDVNWVRPLNKNTLEPTDIEDIDMRGFSYTNDEMAALADDAVAFPVLSFNYFIPTDETDAAVYDMEFAALSKQGDGAYVWDGIADDETSTADWKDLMVRHINSVPVVKNTLTTIWGNFLTAETPSFLVTINDVFDNEIDRVLLYDDGYTYTLITIAGVKVEIERDADGKILFCYVDRNEDKITAENYDELVKGLQDLKIWVDDTFYLDDEPWFNYSNLYIFFNGYLKDNDDILAGHEIANIYLIAEGSLEQPYTNNNFTDDLTIYSGEFDQPNITITNDDYIDVIGNGKDNGGKYSDLDLTSTNELVELESVWADNVKTSTNPANVIDDTYIYDSYIEGTLDVEGDAKIYNSWVIGETNISNNLVADADWFGKLTVGGKAEINDTRTGDLLVEGTADITDSHVTGDAVVNGTATITGSYFDKTTTLNGENNTINGNEFVDEVTLNGSTVINGGTFKNNVRSFADLTFNGGTVETSAENPRFVIMETNGTTLTLNAIVGNISCGDGVPLKSQGGAVFVQGTEAGDGHHYDNHELGDQRFSLQ